MGAYECVKTARCPSAAETEEEWDRDAQWRASFSFLVEAYECDAASFARCEWAPASRCPAGEAGGTLGASRLSGFAADAGAFGTGPSTRSGLIDRADRYLTPRRRSGRCVWSRSRRSGEALAFAAAAFAAAKAAASPVWRGRRFGVSASSDDVESAFPPRADGFDPGNADSTNDGAFSRRRRGFGVDPDALIRGVWMKLGGIEGNAAAGEREPLLGPDVDVSIDRDRDPVDAGVDRPPESSPRELLNANVATEPRTKTKTGGARRKVVFDVDETLAEREPLGAAGGGDLGATARARGGGRPGGARGGGGGARGERRRTRAPRDWRVPRRRGRTRSETGDEYDTKKREDTKNTQTPVGELSREALLERARALTPRRANAAGDTGIRRRVRYIFNLRK